MGYRIVNRLLAIFLSVYITIVIICRTGSVVFGILMLFGLLVFGALCWIDLDMKPCAKDSNKT